MINLFLYRLGQNFKTQPLMTTAVIFGLLIAGYIIGYLVDAIIWIGPVILWVSIPATIWAASYLPQLGWFFGRSGAPKSSTSTKPAESDSGTALNSDGTLPQVEVHHSDDNWAAIARVPRKTPVGTWVEAVDPEQSIVRVQSVVHFWCWFAPTSLSVLAFLLVPVGGFIGVELYKNSRPNYQFRSDEAFYAGINGAVIIFCICIGLAIWSYFSNRPKVKIEITPDYIRYGDKVFDRQHAGGMRIGYKSSGADLATSITDDRFGVTRLRLAYGRWGEDLKYMVNTYHADEIVIWLNEIIDQVGAVEPTGDDAGVGRKTELL